ncbi:hypothetical protein ACFPM1_07835 [Halorubrum rubrum]|uniref:DUF3829 domain-containing protein n=1 Tax=Halorubrum rubrum TaxID=1126240 RepID=A0ABD5R174_9EURY|nr:hypothetical protein [Halorubrum rubrum]
MNRRGALKLLGSTGTIAVAGCVSDGQPPATDDSSPESSNNTSADSSTEASGNTSDGSDSGESDVDVEEALEDAEDNIDRAVRLIEQETTFSFSIGPDASVSTDAIHLALDQADEALDRIESPTDVISEEELQAYRDYVSVLREFTTGLETIGEALNTLSTAEAYRNTQRYEDSIEKLDEAGGLFSDGSEPITSARERLDGIEIDVVDTDAISRTRTTEAFDELAELTDAYLIYTDATIPFYTGLELYWAAMETYEDEEEYADAEETFLEASQHLSTAQTQYLQAESEVPASIRDVFIERTCAAGAMLDSATHMNDASAAAEGGNYENARESENKAVDARNRSCWV